MSVPSEQSGPAGETKGNLVLALVVAIIWSYTIYHHPKFALSQIIMPFEPLLRPHMPYAISLVFLWIAVFCFGFLELLTGGFGHAE